MTMCSLNEVKGMNGIMNQEKIGKFLTELRKERHMTQEELAVELIVDRGTISKWERGVYIPNPEILMELSKLFNVSVNEILYGERHTTENENEVNNIAIEILKDNKRKIKRILHISTAIIIVLSMLFLTYYFMNTYNSIKVYRINGENSNFYIDDGIMIVSNEKAYIKLGDAIRYKDQNIHSYRLYYVKDNQENNVYTSSDINELITNKFGKSELFSYKDIEYIKQNSFIEITYNGQEKRYN